MGSPCRGLGQVLVTAPLAGASAGAAPSGGTGDARAGTGGRMKKRA